MKKIVSILSLIALLALVVPAYAQESHACPHEGDTIANLRDCVVHAAEMGHIDSQGVADSLLSKLDEAQSYYDAGQIKDAVGSLKAFIKQVKAQSGKHIDPMHAEHMIQHANAVIAAISV